MNKKGFTLVELLIVVAIIGILATIAIPNFMGVKGRAVATSAKEDSQSLAAAMEIYYQEHNNYGTDGTLSGAALTDKYKAFKPASDNMFNFEVTISNGGQAFDIKVTPKEGQHFPRDLKELHLDQNNKFEWVN